MPTEPAAPASGGEKAGGGRPPKRDAPARPETETPKRPETAKREESPKPPEQRKPSEPPKPPGGLASRLRLTLLRLSRRLRAETAGRLTASQHSVIATVVAHGPFTPSELATREHVQPPSMTRTIQSLEEQDLLRRTPHPRDRRQVLVEATEPGREYIAETRRRRDRWLSRRLAALTTEERRILSQAEEILRRISTQ